MFPCASSTASAHRPAKSTPLSLSKNFVTPDVEKNGLGGVDAARLERSLDQIGLTFLYTNKPKAADIFTARFLPPKEQRMAK